MLEGTRVRLSGQDSGRGTFSQRHAVLVRHADRASRGRRFLSCDPKQIRKRVSKCLTVRFRKKACSGFEYGYSVVARDALVMWEAQFGDFGNGAQTIIDQYIAASEDKWKQTSRLTMLLPHGYEGQGPEHSSARLERFLQLCAENNLQVCYPTTPAQYFHLLRRQVRPGMERPLIVMTPKSLLRLPAAASTLDELTSGGFQPVIDDAEIKRSDAVERVVLCSGKVYLRSDGSAQEVRRRTRVAIVRLEQFYPFPHDSVCAKCWRNIRTRSSWFGRRKNRRTWAAGRSSNSVWKNFSRPANARSMSDALPRPAPRPAPTPIHQPEQASLVQEALTLT